LDYCIHNRRSWNGNAIILSLSCDCYTLL